MVALAVISNVSGTRSSVEPLPLHSQSTVHRSVAELWTGSVPFLCAPNLSAFCICTTCSMLRAKRTFAIHGS